VVGIGVVVEVEVVGIGVVDVEVVEVVGVGVVDVEVVEVVVVIGAAVVVGVMLTQDPFRS